MYEIFITYFTKFIVGLYEIGSNPLKIKLYMYNYHLIYN